MILSVQELEELCQIAISAAMQAGGLIAKRALEIGAVSLKPGRKSLASQVVTEVDILSQEYIVAALLPTCDRYDLALLAEESVDDRKRLEKDNFWCIDPLDGTLPFVQGAPGYSVSIGLVSRLGVPQIGVVYDPVTQTLYHAIRGIGSFRNGIPWKVAKPSVTQVGHLSFFTDQSLLLHPLYATLAKEFERIALELGCNGVHFTAHGGGVLNACWVLENSPACYFKFVNVKGGGGCLWDYAATACLFAEAGGVACDLDGATLDLNRPDSTFMNHRGVVFASDREIVQRVIALNQRITSS